ncbi:hypothetical protein WA158_001980 [Blastocystis sp. Blastoise]
MNSGDQDQETNKNFIIYKCIAMSIIVMITCIINIGNNLLSILRYLNERMNTIRRSEEEDFLYPYEKSLNEILVYSRMNMHLSPDDEFNNKGMELIRFTNNGPVFKVSNVVIDSLKGSFIDECRADERRTIDGTIYLDYCGNDAFVYYLLDYLNGEKVNFSEFSYLEKLELLDLFEFCRLPIPEELLFVRERKETKMKKYSNGDNVDLITNGNNNDNIKEYLINNGLWNNYVMNYNNGFVDYNHIEDSLYMNKQYEYINYITQYVNNGYIDIEEDKINDINKELLKKEMNELFGDKGRKEAHKKLVKGNFKQSLILNEDNIVSLVDWLGEEKKWKLLFRASEHNYDKDEFHKYCDNKGETVTIIKHIGHDNQINVFGGYTDQSWESLEYPGWKSYSKEFVFTLINEHGIPATKYGYINSDKSFAICSDKVYAPNFGYDCDIYLSNNCHSNNDSYCHASCYDEFNTPQKSSLFVNTNSSENYNYFQVEEYEVWGRA